MARFSKVPTTNLPSSMTSSDIIIALESQLRMANLRAAGHYRVLVNIRIKLFKIPVVGRHIYNYLVQE